MNRASLLVLGAAAFLVSADARAMDPLLKIIAGEFHTRPQIVALAVSAYTLPYGLFQLFYGPLGDRIGKLRVMTAMLALFAGGAALCYFVPNLATFIVLRLLIGVVAAAIIPLSLGYIGDNFPYETRQVALARFMSALMLGQILSNTLGGIFGEHIGWRGIFLVFGGCALLVAAALGREAARFPEEKKERRFSWDAYRTLWRNPVAQIVLCSVFVEGFLVFGGQPYLGASLKDRFGLRYDHIGLLLAGIGLGGLIYSFSVRKFVKQIGELGILLLGGSLLAVGYVGVAFLPRWEWFIPCVVLLGMGYFTMHGTLQTRATEMAPEMRGTAVSFFAFTFFVGQSAGTAVIGQIVKAGGYPVAFVSVGVGLGVLAIVTRALFQRLKEHESVR
jgi:predicted MFS family arabinose efflux permease